MNTFKNIIFILLAIAAVFLTSCEKGETAGDHAAHEYYCPMHPEVTSDKPSVCPICQMDLVKRGSGQTMTDTSFSGLEVEARGVVLANVQTVPVRSESIYREISTSGYLDIAEERRSVITARISGRVERLFVKNTGAVVSKGAPLYEIHSPEILQAQNEFLVALKNVQIQQQGGLELPSLVPGARRRLEILGMSPAQISALEKSRTPQLRITVYAPSSGTVIAKSIEEGRYVAEGTTLYELADLSLLWNIAQIFESDLQAVQKGRTVKITTQAYPGEEFFGKITFISPVLDPQTRTVSVRAEVANRGGLLKPQMYTQTLFKSDMGMGLVVPADAVIVTGERNIVYVKAGEGRFEAREVALGAKFEGKYHILSGLNEGEEVAASGGFLLDSESQLRGNQTFSSAPQTPVLKTSKVDFKAALAQYDAMREAFVASDPAKAKQTANDFKNALFKTQSTGLSGAEAEAFKNRKNTISAATENITKENSIEKQRESFKTISDNFAELLKAFGAGEKVYRAYCPMGFGNKGASWITLTKEIENPYFGEAMLKCGEIAEEIY
ncbi:MAG TPA: efflux RND transporter periplasmic adaptor subunit [Patescibacteria group bacterium]|nr:efflux RND transporter periplasmic adaptor subunit [Patescibacteria group bacterium]